MRKLVLLLLCVALFSFCPSEKDYPLIDLITTNKVLEDVKRLFEGESDEELSDSGETHSHQQSSIARLFNKATEAFSNKISEPIKEALQGSSDEPEVKGQQSLDLSLPVYSYEAFDPTIDSLNDEPENTLPDLFALPETKKKDSRTSIGGRLLMDEQNPNYTMDAVLGAEVSLELKTH